MPKHHTPAQKQEALRLLAIHNDNVPIVEQLTGVPRPTLYRWRKQELSQNAAQMRQKNIPSIDNHSHKTDTSAQPPEPPPIDHSDADLIQHDDFQFTRLPSGQVFARLSDEERERLDYLKVPDPPEPPLPAPEPPLPAPEPPLPAPEPPLAPDPPAPESNAGVPGVTYPYPLEDGDDAVNDYDDFRKVREILMGHAHQLAVNLKPDDPDINRRSLALSRILDRIHQLDAMLPDLNPKQPIRIEFAYDGMVHNVPPDQGIIEDQDEFRRKMTRTILEEGVID